MYPLSGIQQGFFLGGLNVLEYNRQVTESNKHSNLMLRDQLQSKKNIVQAPVL